MQSQEGRGNVVGINWFSGDSDRDLREWAGADLKGVTAPSSRQDRKPEKKECKPRGGAEAVSLGTQEISGSHRGSSLH